MNDKGLQGYLDRLLTTDYKGSEDKLDALKCLLTPLMEALVQCEAKCWAGTPESQEAFSLLRTYAKYGLGDLIRDHELVSEELNNRWKRE